jgi:precorrin-6B methylase 2
VFSFLAADRSPLGALQLEVMSQSGEEAMG